MSRMNFAWLLVLSALCCNIDVSCSQPYYGLSLGPLVNKAHDVRGSVYIVDSKRVRIRNFFYDGTAPDAFFMVGEKSKTNVGDDPGAQGTQLKDELGRETKLGGYSDADIVLTLPDNVEITDINWLAVWCKDFSVNFGHIKFLDLNISAIPAPVVIGQFSTLAHKVASGTVTILDERRAEIKNFIYDGNGPDAFFVAGEGAPVEPFQKFIKLLDETGSVPKIKARKYDNEDVIVTLPMGETFKNKGYISMYCIQYTHDFGNVLIPEGDLLLPPYVEDINMQPYSNCEQLNKFMNVEWEIKSGILSVGLSGRIDEIDYMAFGLSGSADSSAMTGADVTVVFIQQSDKIPKAVDYTINDYSQCSNGKGACPDVEASAQEDVTIISANRRNGITSVRYQRNLDTGDTTGDKVYPANEDVYVVWAIGGLSLDGRVTKHHTRVQGHLKYNFGRTSKRSCGAIEVPDVVEDKTPWDIPMLSGKESKVFTVNIGPAGQNKGYRAITGRPSWGIAWYINGYLIPEIELRRNETFIFKVEGGSDPEQSARYHPFYITDDPVGGYVQKTTEQKKKVTIYGGLSNGTTGRYCEWEAKTVDKAAESQTFEDYKKTLSLKCEQEGSAGELIWTPDSSTPDLLYYQCFTHNYLGWKIHIVDEYSGSSNNIANCAIIMILLVSLSLL